ncbi:ArsR/SmtB family transcription factor [Micromonospora aurantiaca (nom. illeg.)]|uniref:ArsR/SmtB family transcription factor n=1 Tax=Micromonospora aurantiaca (nom. illeg.) TaxID=47850 RepID=UPI0011CD91BE|nr:ArsR family transcriptional regulator [Micromonospora aurantiaca]
MISDLAESLGLSASTTSEHLSALLAADMVHTRREGVRVIYALDGAGLALLKYLDGGARLSGEAIRGPVPDCSRACLGIRVDAADGRSTELRDLAV